jgi:hypothetical protein
MQNRIATILFAFAVLTATLQSQPSKPAVAVGFHCRQRPTKRQSRARLQQGPGRNDPRADLGGREARFEIRCTVLVAGLFIWFLQLRHVVKDRNERTLVAITIVFAYCFSALIPELIVSTTGLKEVTLVVVGFYFGANQAGKQTP